MENQANQERVLTFNLAIEITPEEMEQVSGGATKGNGTRNFSHDTTFGGQDHTYDVEPD